MSSHEHVWRLSIHDAAWYCTAEPPCGETRPAPDEALVDSLAETFETDRENMLNMMEFGLIGPNEGYTGHLRAAREGER